jgi:two-component system response regulator RegX3
MEYQYERPTTPRLKALVIFDEPESGKIWGSSLQQIGLEVVLEDSNSDFITTWGNELPDLIIIEDFNKKKEELEICRKLRFETPVPILLLTHKTEESFLLAAYKAGFDECIVQPISPHLFLAKVRARLRETRIMPSSALEILNIEGFRLDPERRYLTTDDKKVYKLTNLENRLLYLLMSYPGRIFSCDALISRVWGLYGNGDTMTLKNVVYRLRRKLETDPHNPRHLITEDYGYKFLAG